MVEEGKIEKRDGVEGSMMNTYVGATGGLCRSHGGGLVRPLRLGGLLWAE